MIWQTSRHRVDLTRVRIMGVVNVTPDSFSDGGRYVGASAAIAHCEHLLQGGADILDIGGESSRPGAPQVSIEEELTRILPVVEAALEMGCPVSVDTAKPEVMRRVLAMGVDIVNDISALQTSGGLEAVVAHGSCGVVLMHMLGNPRTMQSHARYVDVVAEVRSFLLARADTVMAAGIGAQRIVLDPGIGFGKSVENNVELLVRQRELAEAGFPLLVGWSRKSTLGALTGRPVSDRLIGSVAAALASVQNGANLIRVHDVAATADALSVWRAAGLCK
ncbi:MAG: dihydropteroate synthase [Burkholderiaceae bacterium]